MKYQEFNSKKEAFQSNLGAFCIHIRSDEEYLRALEIDASSSKEIKDSAVDSYFEEIAVHMGSLKNDPNEYETFLKSKIIPPQVGAVVVVGDIAYCAKRSAFKHGDHAEHTILDTMLSQIDFKDHGGVLYGTLEPCTKLSRSAWTTSCTELIIARGIKKVFIGSLDNNPLVEGQGIARLLESGVEVHFFKPKYANACRKQNEEFRAQFLLNHAKEIKCLHAFLYTRLDISAVSFFINRHNDSKIIWKEVTTIEDEKLWKFYAGMLEKGYIHSDGKSCQIEKEFALLFLKEPSEFVPCYEIDFIKGIDANDKKNDDTIRLNANLLRLFSSNDETSLLSYFCLVLQGEKPSRVITDDRLYSLLMDYCGKNVDVASFKEAVLNALIHHDYNSGAPIVFVFGKKKVQIRNYTSLLDEKDLTILEEGLWPSAPTNPKLMQLFVDCKLAQRSGRGMPMVSKFGSIQARNFRNVCLIDVCFPKGDMYAYR